MKTSRNFLALLCLLGAWALSPINAKPLKVYVLCGQSNMEGHAKISTFEAMKTDSPCDLTFEYTGIVHV